MTSEMALVVTGAFFALILVVGVATRRWVSDMQDFLLGSREMSGLVTSLGILAIVWGGDVFALFSIFAIAFGLYAAIVPAVSISLAYIVYGTVFSTFVRTVGTYTLGEFLEIRYDGKTRVLLSFYAGLSMLIVLPAGALSVASIVNGYTGWPVALSATGMIVVVGAIILVGGLWGVTVTDIIQATIGYTVLPVLLFWLILNVGGPNWLVQNVPGGEVAFSFPGQFGLGIGPNSYLTWAILWGGLLVFGSPYYWIRAVAARSDAEAKRGYQTAGVVGLGLSIFFGVLPLYAFAIAPDVFTVSGGSVPPAGAIGVLAGQVPQALGVVFMVTIIAAGISTYTTSTMGGIGALSRDIYQRVVAPQAGPREMLAPTRVITVLFLIGGLALVTVNDIQLLLSTFLTLIGVSSLITLAGVYTKYVTAPAAFVAGMTGGIVALGWPMFGVDPSIHQVYPTIVAIVVPLLGVSLVTEAAGVGASERRTAGNEGPSGSLTQSEKTVLTFLSVGANTFGDLLDALAVDSTEVDAVVVGLEEKGLIRRRGWTGTARFTFEMTTLGRRSFKTSVDSERTVHYDGTKLTREALDALMVLQDAGESLRAEDFSSALELDTASLGPHLELLVTTEFVRKRGLLRVRYELTATGEAFVESNRSSKQSEEAQTISNRGIGV